MKILNITALEILDSRGNPTVRTVLELADGSKHTASVPSGASTGAHEALELRDNEDALYDGKSVTRAVDNVNTAIKDAIRGKEADPKTIDKLLIDLDGTENKGKLGANAILSVSMAIARAAAHAENKSLWKFLNEYYFQDITPGFPQLMVNVINGGKHANWNFDIQEFILVPNSKVPSIALAQTSEVFHAIGRILTDRQLSTLVGDEGGYSPTLASNEEVFDLIITAAQTKGFKNIHDYRVSIDAAASEFYKEGYYNLNGQKLKANGLTDYYADIGQKYNILSFEDAFAEDDTKAFIHFEEMAKKFQFISIGDDLFCTNPERITRGINEKWANGVIIKLNQIGTVTETVEAIHLAKKARWKVAVSHRSGETEDNFISDLAYSCAANFLKAGSMSRSERLAKYNRLLEIEVGL